MQGASLARFVTLAAFIVSVALSLWLADADAVWIVVGVAAAWLVASIIEWVAWNMGERDYGLYEREWRTRAGYDQPNVAGRATEPAPQYIPPPPPPPPVARPDPPPPPPPPVPEPEPGPEPVPIPPAAVAGPTARALRIGRFRIVLRGGADAAAVPEPQPEPTPAAEPEPVPEPLMLVAAPEPEPEPEPVPVVAAPVQPPPAPVRSMEPVAPPERPRPTVVPAPPPPEVVRPAAAAPPPPQPSVTRLSSRRRDPRQWNLWELERLVRDAPPLQAEEWHYLFVNLRRFAEPDGALPVEFDSLVRESFGPLLDGLES